MEEHPLPAHWNGALARLPEPPPPPPQRLPTVGELLEITRAAPLEPPCSYYYPPPQPATAATSGTSSPAPVLTIDRATAAAAAAYAHQHHHHHHRVKPAATIFEAAGFKTWPMYPTRSIVLDATARASHDRISRRWRRPKTYANRTPSRFCHVCQRKSGNLVVCSNVKAGLCRKVVCEICFDTNGWNWEEANRNEWWQCPHCTNICPKRAQCQTYEATNERRRKRDLMQKIRSQARAQ